MGEDYLTTMSIENFRSTFLSMDSIATTPHEESDYRDMNRQIVHSGAPDINLPLSGDRSPPSQSWNLDGFDMSEGGLGQQIIESDALLSLTKVGRKCAKRLDSVWGAWVFFTFYFKPVLKENTKCNIVLDSSGMSGFEKSDLDLDVFLVQHDMENMYMWVFKERPENALGIMQLRNYINGHSRQGERQFPFSVDKGFVRSHKMQRKHYRGLSNPQCLHGIELVPCPNLLGLDDEEQKKWIELTSRDLNFSVEPEARDFCSWRNLPNTDFELERPLAPLKSTSHPPHKRSLNGLGLNLLTQPSSHVNSSGIDLLPYNNKKRKEYIPNGNDYDCCLATNDQEIHPIEPPWIHEFSGVMKNSIYGPVTAAKSIYEDEEGYLIIVTLPFSDPEKVKVHWWNNLTHGIVKISATSTACMPLVKRKDRTFKLTDPSPEHCPHGEFKREIPLATRIPDDAKLEAYFDKSKTVLEIKVPKYRVGPEEHEVLVSLCPPNDCILY